MYRFGIGYDIHRFGNGRKLVLGGVEVPYERGLEGHSDADVLSHAICDAILGALGQGDIGEHFPNTDEKYKNVSSLTFLEEAKALAERQGYEVVNIDSVIQAEEPNIKSHKDQMRKTLASALNMEKENINIKATTQEKLGAIGQKEGIAAFASALLMKKG